MRNNRLGCLSGMGILAAIITTFVIAGFAYTRGGNIFSPGPLNAQTGTPLGGVTSHAETDGNCKACHVAPWQNAHMADRCAECHGGINAQLQDLTSLHGKMMFDNPGLTCRDCHSEHRGANAPLTVMMGANFPHETVGYSLTGHQLTATKTAFTCDDCHHGDITTFVLDSCQTCHSQIDLNFTQTHATEYGTACLDCHDGADRFGKNFQHNFTFQLTGQHTNVTCFKCHTTARAVADFSKIPTDCNSCHQKDEPHEGRFGTDCGACHTVEGWKPAKFDHNLAAFKLIGKHVEVKCEACHINNVYKGTPSDCYACHQKDDHHNGKFGTDCFICHQPTSWEDVTFEHSKSNFPLTGKHAGLACQQCHVNAQFKGLSTACASCHGEPGYHAGLFGNDCASCHTTKNWSARYNGPHPAISNEGGSGVNHGGASCRDCHTQTLRTATCTKCHDKNKPGDGGGGND